MKFTVISRGDDHSKDTAQEVRFKMEKIGLQYDDEKPEFVFTVGGDGTLLYAFHRFKSRLDKVAFVGIHTGHLGFYADWTVKKIDELVNAIANEPLQVVEYPLLEVTVSFIDASREMKYLALNEATIKASIGNTMVVDVEVQNTLFETFRGDGLCFSTPSGSTAYNKSLGGAILHPTISAMQMAEMASINNRVYRTIGSPLVIPKHQPCLLRPINKHEFNMTIDHLHVFHSDVRSIEYRVSEKTVRFARFRPHPFWKRVRESFITD